MRSRTFVVVLLCFGFLACGESTSRTVEPRIRLTTPAGNALPATLAFDPAPVGGHSDRTIRIHADTAAALEIRDIAFEAEDGASAEVFAALDVDLPLHVPALQHRDVTLRFSPALVATYEATLVVRSSDPARGAVRVPVAGEGIAGRLEVSACRREAEAARCAGEAVRPPDPLDLGRITEGAHAAALVILQNGGADDLDVHAVDFVEPAEAAAAGFSFRENPGSGMRIRAFEAGTFTVDFSPPAGTVGTAAATIRIESSSITDPVVEVDLVAEVAPNEAPLACVYVREVHHVDGTVDRYEPGDEVGIVRPADQVILDARAEDGCSGDPEDGAAIEVDWTAETPTNRGRLDAVGGQPMQRRLEIDATGTYRVAVEVRDSLGRTSTTDAAGNPAEVELVAVPQEDVAVEISWAGSPDVDLDLHFVRAQGLGGMGTDDDCHWDNPSPNWGGPDRFDDPRYLVDSSGADDGLVETTVLNGPEAGFNYWIYAHYARDRRLERNQAASCSATSECADGLVCSAGRCMAPVEVRLRVFFDGAEFDLTGMPDTAILEGPCDTWLAGRVFVPAGGGAPSFATDALPVFQEGMIGENATCILSSGT